MKIRILFVCLGNVCRSPMAEAVMRHKLAGAGLSEQVEVDSAGFESYHEGDPPHRGTRQLLDRRGIPWKGQTSRVFRREDADDFDYIIGMDRENISDLDRACGGHLENIYLFSELVENADWEEVPDPYYSGNFELTYRLVEQGCTSLLERLRAQLGGADG